MPTVQSVALELIRELDENIGDLGLHAQFEAHVNNALDEIALITEYNHFQARTPINTVATQATYTLPVGAREVLQLRFIDTGSPIELFSIQDAAHRGLKMEEPGRPQIWLEDGVEQSGSDVLLRIRFVPVPDAIYPIEAYYIFHPADVGASAQLPIQPQILTPLKYLVKARWHVIRQRYDAADRERQNYEKAIARVVRREQRKLARRTILGRNVDIARIRQRRGGPLPPDHFENRWGW
jgi:hypothetical protein